MNTALLLNSASIERVIDEHRYRKVSDRVSYLGLDFVIDPNVFSPFRAPSGLLTLGLASMPFFRGKSILELGCGAGVFSCLAVMHGASHVTAIDNNPYAVQNTIENAKNLDVLHKIEIVHSDLFKGVKEKRKFDVIYADLPFTKGAATTWIERAFHDPTLESLFHACSEIPHWLRDEKSMAFIVSSDHTPVDCDVEVAKGGAISKPFITLDCDFIKVIAHKVSLTSY